MCDLWNVTVGIDCEAGEKPRAVNEHELIAYLDWLAKRDGIYVPAGASYGPAGISTTGDGVIVPMPGYGQPQTVTVDLLDEAGDVIRSSTIGLDRKGHLGIKAPAVREMVGKVDKPRAVRKARSAPVERVEAVEAVDAPATAPVDAVAVPVAAGDVIAALVARIEALEANATSRTATLTTCASSQVPTPANDTTARRARSEREASAVRRAWRIRCEARERADLDARALEAANGAYRGLLDAYGHRAEELATVRADLAMMTEQQANARRAATEYKREAETAARHLFGAEERAAAAERRATRMVRVAADYRTQARRAVEDARGLKAEARALARRLEDAKRDVATSRARPAPAAPTDTTMARAFAAAN